MTDVFYIAVKGSLYAGDSSVFGLNNEEIAALSKRFSDVKKEVINGILIKANPLQVINCLSELGYRVACSSGEAEIIWTLRREVLAPRLSYGGIEYISKQRTPEIVELPSGRERRSTFDKPPGSISSSAREKRPSAQQQQRPSTEKRPLLSRPITVKKEEKKEERIGAKPEDLAEYLGYSGSRILVIDPEEIENVPEEQKIIIKSNENSEGNPITWTNTGRHVSRDSSPVIHPNHQIQNLAGIPCRADDMSCARPPPVPSVHQTMEDMDFERGIWYSALTGDLPRVRTLLEKGTNPNVEDKNGYTALHYAARCGFTAICTLLLEAGASVNKGTRAGGATPLHRAALAGNDDTVTVLIKYGANLLSKDADGRLPLHRAVESKQPTTVALLLEASPESITIKDRTGKTARHYIQPNDKVIGDLFDIVDKSTAVGVRPIPTAKTTTSSRTRNKDAVLSQLPNSNSNQEVSSTKDIINISEISTEKDLKSTDKDSKPS